MRWTGIVVVLGLGLATAGCGTVGDPVTSSSSPPASGSTPEASTAPTSDPGAEMVGAFEVQTPVDSGPREYASGTTTLDEDGEPVAYEVASGDIIDYVAERFGFEGAQPADEGFTYLNTINQVRRGGYPWPLYAGDIVNLSAYRITSIGTINGEVLDEEPPDPLPPQR